MGSEGEKKPDHLLVLVHGLADTCHAWDNFVKELRKMESEELLVYASAVNARFRTHDGFDKCGERLAAEIEQLVQQHPHLRRLSVIGHSMGGMIARYAVGVLFRPLDATICGLAPAHYVTLATPHLGLTVDDGPAQVPFVSWAGDIPLLGRGVKSALQSVAHTVARTFFRGTGRHFLALDGGPGELPLLMMLATDAPDRGQYFLSALRAFASRACYGNVARDHWVSWENATIRATKDLPYINPGVIRHGRGIVRQDPPEAGISPGLLPPLAAALRSGSDNSGGGALAAAATARLEASPACAGSREDGSAAAEASTVAAATASEFPGSVNTATTASDATAATIGQEPLEAGPRGSVCLLGAGQELVAGRREGSAGGAAVDSGGETTVAAAGVAREAAAVAAERAVESTAESPGQVVSFALDQLRQLPWRRVDVSFAGARIGTAHNNIQATRWTNRVGFAVLEHLRGHLQAVDQLLLAAAGATESGGRDGAAPGQEGVGCEAPTQQS